MDGIFVNNYVIMKIHVQVDDYCQCRYDNYDYYLYTYVDFIQQ